VGLTNRKRKYQSVKSHETTDIDQRSKHSVSIPTSVIEQECNDAMKMVARWILAIPNFESDTMNNSCQQPGYPFIDICSPNYS
jgi:hypothetical protein